jgi:class 3 adenylate cyclase
MTEQPGDILVVDDDVINRRLLVRSLELDGHTVIAAQNGREALDRLARDRVDVVLLDIVMPELDGVSVLTEIKADPGLRHIPVIMISAVDEADSVIGCIKLGADDYLPKPFDPVLLRARIGAGLAKKRLHDLERERVRDVFARFVPEQIVDQVISLSGADLRLGGALCTGTILFNDLRNFTTFSETTPADQALEVLNVILGEMSDVILDHGGSHLGYRGDGMMAAFGAPIETPDHADRAAAAAREMLAVRLPRLNAMLREQGVRDGFRMGVGIASGRFMAGNVGSARRLEYTAIGDVANTAARLEAMTKGTPNPVLMSEATRLAMVAPPDDLTFVGEFDVRGKHERVRLWTLADLGHDAGDAVAVAASVQGV